MNKYSQEISFEGEVFSELRAGANVILRDLLESMMKKGSKAGCMTIKVDVELVDDASVGKLSITPEFTYKISSAMHLKSEIKGKKNCGGCEMVWDDGAEQYILMPITGAAQRSVFDGNEEE